jgi:hypothetical protein
MKQRSVSRTCEAITSQHGDVISRCGAAMYKWLPTIDGETIAFCYDHALALGTRAIGWNFSDANDTCERDRDGNPVLRNDPRYFTTTGAALEAAKVQAAAEEVTLCSLGHVHGPLTDEAREELNAFARHLQDHPRNVRVKGCRFCEARMAKTASKS